MVTFERQKKGGLTVSVFAVTSCAVYLLGTLESLPNIAKAIQLTVVTEEGEQLLELPGLAYPVIIAHTSMAARLYAHAWAVDSLPILGSEKLTNVIRKVEWILRALWVFLVSYLPNCFSKVASGEELPLGLSLWGYYTTLFLILIGWDFAMYREIMVASGENSFVNLGDSPAEQRQKMKHLWLFFDVVLLIISVSMALLSFRIDGTLANWKPIVFVGMIFAAGVICLVQMVIWIPEIRRRLKFEAQLV